MRRNSDEAIRDLQREASTGDPSARSRLLHEAGRRGVFGLAMTSEHPDRNFVMALQLLGFLGDPSARGILKSRGETWLQKLGPDILLEYGNYVSAHLALAAAEFAYASASPIDPSGPASVLAEAAISNRDMVELLGRARSVLSEVERREARDRHDGNLFRSTFPISGTGGDLLRMRQELRAAAGDLRCAYPVGAGIHLVAMAQHETCLAVRTATIYVATAGWSDHRMALSAIDHAVNARAQVLAARSGCRTTWLEWRRRANAEVKEAMRREILPWLTRGFIPPEPPLSPNPPARAREVESFRCPWCHEELAPAEAVFCPACGAPQHFVCAEETGHCGVCRKEIPSASWDTLEERAEREAGYGRAIGRTPAGPRPITKKEEDEAEREYLEEIQQEMESHDTPSSPDTWSPGGSRRRRRPERVPEPPKIKVPPRRRGRRPWPRFVDVVKGDRTWRLPACTVCEDATLLVRGGSSMFRCPRCGAVYEDPKR